MSNLSDPAEYSEYKDENGIIRYSPDDPDDPAEISAEPQLLLFAESDQPLLYVNTALGLEIYAVAPSPETTILS